MEREKNPYHYSLSLRIYVEITWIGKPKNSNHGHVFLLKKNRIRNLDPMEESLFKLYHTCTNADIVQRCSSLNQSIYSPACYIKTRLVSNAKDMKRGGRCVDISQDEDGHRKTKLRSE